MTKRSLSSRLSRASRETKERAQAANLAATVRLYQGLYGGLPEELVVAAKTALAVPELDSFEDIARELDKVLAQYCTVNNIVR